MKRRILFIISVVITALGLTAFAINSNTLVSKECEVKIVDSPLDQKDTTRKYFTYELAEKKTIAIDLELAYLVRGDYNRPISLEKLRKAKTLGDIIPYYPTTWITNYTLTEIQVVSNSKDVIATSLNDVLSIEQINLLSSSDLADEIFISVKFITENDVSKKIENREMNVSFTVIPEIEAAFIGGYEQLIAYLIENSNDKISASSKDQFEPSTILFVVSENGEIEDVDLIKTTGNAEIDILLVELISNMPKWKPAENATGSKVEQQFVFNFGMFGC